MRCLRWLVVGWLGYGVQLAVLLALSRLSNMPYGLAATVAVASAVVHNFVWHERWTWRDRIAEGFSARARRFIQFSGWSTLMAMAGTVSLTLAYVDIMRLSLPAANLLAVLSLSPINFLASERFVFRKARSLTVSAIALAACVSSGFGYGVTLSAAELQPSTLASWQQYVRSVEARIGAELASADGPNGRCLRTVDCAALRSGRIVVERGGPRASDAPDVPGGTIHHWRGALFVPNVTLQQVLDELRSSDPRRHLQEDVVAYQLLSGGDERQHVYLKLVRKEVVTVTYNTVHDVQYRQHGPARASSRSVSVKIAELDQANTPREREKPQGEDRGFLWRLNSYWRYEAVPGGVILEVESLTLSRDVPLLLAAVAKPIINGIARESMTRTLEAIRDRMRRGR
jgi:putative flippase GtrA